MPKYFDIITQQELGQRIQNNMPISGCVMFDNQKSAVIEITPLGIHDIESQGIGSFGMISFSDCMPSWVTYPNIINYLELDSVKRYKLASNILTAVGTTSNMVRLSETNTTVRFSKAGKFSFKFYRSGWKGGSRAKIKTYKITSLANNEKPIFWLGLIVEGMGIYNDVVSPQKGAVNVLMNAVGLIKGGPGLAISLIYWGLDQMGVFDYPKGKISRQTDIPKLSDDTLKPSDDTLKQPVDNLRVVIPQNQAPIKPKPEPHKVIRRNYEY